MAEGWAPGLLCLKGGDLRSEIDELKKQDPEVNITATPVRQWIDAPYFEEKVLLHVRRS